MARAPFAAWRPIPSATDPKIDPIGVILHHYAGTTLPIRASEATRRTVTPISGHRTDRQREDQWLTM